MKILIVSADRTTNRGVPHNLGDAFLTDALMEGVSASGHSVVAADFGGARTDSGLARVRLSGLSAFWRAIRDADALVLGGGTLLQADRPERPLGGLPRLVCVTALLAKAARRPLVVLGVGCDPVKSRLARILLSIGLRLADAAWVRDPESHVRCARQFGVDVRIGADTSLLLSRQMAARTVSADRRTGAVLALNRADASTISLKDVRSLRDEYGPVHFLSMDQTPGDRDSDSLPTAVAEELGCGPADLSWEDAAKRIGVARIVVASRMHAMYLAAMLDVPVVAVGGLPKVRSFATQFGVPVVDGLHGQDLGRLGWPNAALRRNTDELRTRMAESLEDALGVLEANPAVLRRGRGRVMRRRAPSHDGGQP